MTSYLFAAYVLSSAAVGQGSAPTRVAVVDVPRVHEQYERTKMLESKLDERKRRFADERESRVRKIEQDTLALKEFKAGTDDYYERQIQLARAQAETEVFVEREQARMQHELADSFRSIFEDIQDMVRSVAEERGIDVVFLAADKISDPAAGESSSVVKNQILLNKVVYWRAELDITEEIVNRLNAKFKAGKTPAPDPKAGAPPDDRDAIGAAERKNVPTDTVRSDADTAAADRAKRENDRAAMGRNGSLSRNAE